VAAHADQGFTGTLGFRSDGVVELWDPVTGKTTPAQTVRRESSHTRVALDLPPSGSVFVVFRKTGQAAFAASAVPTRQVAVGGPWSLAFPAGWGTPASVRLDTLKSWTELDGPAPAKAFSGTAVYTAEFVLDTLAANACVELDLGRVEVIACVRVNGKAVGSVWAPPYKVDVSRAVKAGGNRLSVEVTSTWFNRLAYDAGLPEADRKTWTIKGPPRGSTLKPSGLLGPVTVNVK